MKTMKETHLEKVNKKYILQTSFIFSDLEQIAKIIVRINESTDFEYIDSKIKEIEQIYSRFQRKYKTSKKRISKISDERFKLIGEVQNEKRRK